SGNRFSDKDMREAKGPPAMGPSRQVRPPPIPPHRKSGLPNLRTILRSRGGPGAARGGECTECAALLCVKSGGRRSWRAAAQHRAEPAFGEPRRSARRPVSNHQNPPIGPNDFCRNRQASLGPRRGTYVAAEGDVGGKWGAYWSSWGAARFRLESPR